MPQASTLPAADSADGEPLATDGPIVSGPLLYAARYGILSVHAAQLPTFRGNWTTYFNLYHNLPLVVSGFIMQPWVDEGVLLGVRKVPVTRGMNLVQVNEAALHASVDLAAELLQKWLQERFLHVAKSHGRARPTVADACMVCCNLRCRPHSSRNLRNAWLPGSTASTRRLHEPIVACHAPAMA